MYHCTNILGTIQSTQKIDLGVLFFPYPTLETTGLEDLQDAVESAKEKSEHGLERKKDTNAGRGYQRKDI